MAPEQGWRGHWRRLRWLQTDLPPLMRHHGADLLLSPLPEAPLLRGVRSVVLAHDLLPLRHPKPTPLLPYHLSYVPLVLHQAELVLCNSEATAREVRQRLRVPLRKLVPIRLGFNPQDLHPMDLPREPFLLVLGSHFPHKNLARVLRSFAAVNDSNLQLKLIGPQDPRYTPRLKQLARELGIEERCHWLRWVSNAERLELLNRCQALVIASLWEGFGLPALEAMACGTPVIAGALGALPEVVGEVGLLVDPRNTAAISDAMRRSGQDRAWAANARSQGPIRAAQFRWEATAHQIETILQELA
jgi:glycosyltransferase involved in cell wall biosynthesis